MKEGGEAGGAKDSGRPRIFLASLAWRNPRVNRGLPVGGSALIFFLFFFPDRTKWDTPIGEGCPVPLSEKGQKGHVLNLCPEHVPLEEAEPPFVVRQLLTPQALTPLQSLSYTVRFQ